MKLHEGRSGTQEIACLVGLSAGITGLFGVNSKLLYSNGNISYISIPIGVIISLFVTLLACEALKCQSRVKQGDLFVRLAAIVEIILLVFGGIIILYRLTHAIHFLIFGNSDYEYVLIWTVLTVLTVALPGFETVSRTARCVSTVIIVLLIVTMGIALDGGEAYRLSPFPGKEIKQAAEETALLSAILLPGSIAVVFYPKSANGYVNARRGTLVGAIVAAVLIAAVQLVLSMGYAYSELAEHYMPLYELNMILPNEGYFMRYDKLLLFVWLIGALVACAYYVYSAGNILCRVTHGSDARPAAAAICTLVGVCVLYMDKSAWLHEVMNAAPWGAAALVVLFICTYIAGKVKLRRKHETA